MGGFVANYAKQPGVAQGRAREVMKCFAPEDIPVLASFPALLMAGTRWLGSFEDFKKDVKNGTLPPY